MTFISCPDRDRILAAVDHVLVTGGPGCGKTTVALRKALLRVQAGLERGQNVLFLSFSRAAIGRIVQAARGELPGEARQQLEIQTFHSFCWHLVRGHGYLLGAPQPLRLIPPHEERALRDGATEDDPAWDAERERLFTEGRIVFDLFAPKAAALLNGSAALRALIAGRYPMVIVDEAQDTGTDQWRCVAALAESTQVICLADRDQQIYEFRRDVSPERVAHIVERLRPLEVSLGGQNNRSQRTEIVAFGNDILAVTPRGTPYSGVSHMKFQANADKRDNAIRQAVGRLSSTIKSTTGEAPRSIGYLTNWGRGVAIIARALQGGDAATEIRHRVEMDEAAVVLATRVVAFCLEPVEDIWHSLAAGLELVAELHRAGGKTDKWAQLMRNAADARQGQLPARAKCAAALKRILEELRATAPVGNPGADWLDVRRRLEASGAKELEEVARAVLYLMAFHRGRRISHALAEVWQRRGRYEQARALVEAAITEDQLIGGDADLHGIHVMTIHKSKGKEFDGVILLHLGRLSPFAPDHEQPPHGKSRRLLRVGVTRARRHVLLLTDAYSDSPLLGGHVLA